LLNRARKNPLRGVQVKDPWLVEIEPNPRGLQHLRDRLQQQYLWLNSTTLDIYLYMFNVPWTYYLTRLVLAG
jgi:hypothetical protein